MIIYKIFMSRHTKRAVLVLLIAVIFLLSGLIYHTVHKQSLVQTNHNTGVFISSKSPVGQTIVLDKNVKNIGKIGLHIDYKQWGENEILMLNIWDSPLKKQLLGSAILKNPKQHWVYAKLNPPLKTKQDEPLYLELTHNGGGDNHVGWIVSSNIDPYPRGKLYVGGEARKNDDLSFRICSREVRPNYLGLITLVMFFAFIYLKEFFAKTIRDDTDAAFLKISLVLTILYILFLTYQSGSIVGIIYSGDDNSYYGYAASLVNDFDLDFSNNELSGVRSISSETGKLVSPHPIGTSLLLIPFYAAAKPIVHVSDWFTHAPFNQRHPVFFLFMSSGIALYLFLGGLLLYKAASFLFDKRSSLLAAILVTWGSILPIYAFKRPIFTHVPEFFLISLLIYLTLRLHNKLKSGNTRQIKHREAFVLGLVNGGILITRWNDVHVLLFPAFFLLAACSFKLRNLWKNKVAPLLIFVSSAAAVFFFTQCQAWKYFLGSYYELPYKLPKLLPSSVSKLLPSSTPQIKSSFSGIPVLAHLHNPLHIFIGLDWGLLYTMLPMVVGLAWLLLFNPFKISRSGLLDRIVYVIVFSVPFILVLKWKTQASYYGYRYLISLLPFSCIGLAGFLKYVTRGLKARKLLYLCVAALLLFNLLLMLPFENSEGTVLKRGVSTLGGGGYINNAYVINSIKFYLNSPLRQIINIFSYGFGATYVHGFEKSYVSIYPVIVILLIFASFVILRRKL